MIFILPSILLYNNKCILHFKVFVTWRFIIEIIVKKCLLNVTIKLSFEVFTWFLFNGLRDKSQKKETLKTANIYSLFSHYGPHVYPIRCTGERIKRLNFIISTHSFISLTDKSYYTEKLDKYDYWCNKRDLSYNNG